MLLPRYSQFLFLHDSNTLANLLQEFFKLFCNLFLVERAGFEPAKALPPDLQSGPVDRLGNLSIDEEVTLLFSS